MVEDGAPVRRRRLGAHGTTPCLKALDRLDRHQTVASADQVYDDEARKKLMDKINRMAANFGIDENFAAAVQERLKTVGAMRGARARRRILRIPPTSREERTRLGRLVWRLTAPDFFTPNGRNPLKRLIPKK
jgi:hypothetical protein